MSMLNRCGDRLPGGLCMAIMTLLAASSALAGPERLRLVDASAWGGFFSGGPYEVRPTDFGFAPGGAGEFGADPGNFITFAIEASGDLWEGPFDYHVAFSDSAVGNGLGGGDPDLLDDRTAFLYTAFATGQIAAKLASFDGSIFVYEHSSSGHALQDAIWHIEAEIGGVAGLAASLVAMADAAIADGGEWFGKGLGEVRVMKMTDAGGYGYQDLLVLQPTMVPLPAPALLATAGLTGGLVLARLRRRRVCPRRDHDLLGARR